MDDSNSKYLKEIYEQSDAISLTLSESHVCVEKVAAQIASKINKVVLVGCGDAYFIAVAAAHAFRAISGLPAIAVEGLEFVLYSDQHLDSNTLVVGISQSGKTIQVREALRLARNKGCPSLAVSNSKGSPLVEIADCYLLSKAGLSVAFPTKTTTSMLTILILFTVYLGRKKENITKIEHDEWLSQISLLPDKVRQSFELNNDMEKLANSLSTNDYFTYLATGPGYSTALIGSAKIKEICSNRANAFQLEEFAHLHAFSARTGDPLFFIVNTEKNIARAVEIANYVKRYGVRSYAYVPDSLSNLWLKNDTDIYKTPDSHEILSPIIQCVPLQLFAYYLALAKGKDPDRPTGFDEIALHNLLYSDLLEGWFT